MSIRPYKKKPGRWVIDYYPLGRKGKKVLKVFAGSEADAQALELELRRQYQIPLSVNPKTKDVLPERFSPFSFMRGGYEGPRPWA